MAESGGHPQPVVLRARPQAWLAQAWCPPTTYSYSPAVLKAGVQRAPPLWQDSRGAPRTYSYSPAVLKAGVQRAPPTAGGLGVSPRTYSYSPAILKAGVQRAPLPGLEGVPQPSSKREPEGAPLAGLGVSPRTGGVPPHYSYSPAILKAGVQRDAAHCQDSGGVPQHIFVLPRHPQSGSAEGAAHCRGSGGVPPHYIRTPPPSSKRECRGTQSHCQEVWRVSLQHLFVLPRHPQSGSAEGAAHCQGSGGVPPAPISTP